MAFERTTYSLSFVDSLSDLLEELSTKKTDIVVYPGAACTRMYFANEVSLHQAQQALDNAIGEGEYKAVKDETTEVVFCFTTNKSPTVVIVSLKKEFHIS